MKRTNPHDKPKPKPSPDTTVPPITTKKRCSKWLKVAGAALLLTAFGLQMRQNQQSALSLERTQAAELDGRANIRALAYENLYSSNKIMGVETYNFLKLAAMQYYEGRASMMVTSPADKEAMARELHELRAAAENVHDMPSFEYFMKLHNDSWDRRQPTELAGMIDPDKDAKRLGKIYLALYIFGSALAIAGQILD
jgi:hypothetical protein